MEISDEERIAAAEALRERIDVITTGERADYECSEHIMRCLNCGAEFGYVLYGEDGDVSMDDKPNYCPHCGVSTLVSAITAAIPVPERYDDGFRNQETCVACEVGLINNQRELRMR